MAVPSDAHLLAFGRIMHAYAAVESGIKIAMSGILEISLSNALIAFDPYSANNVKNVAKSLAKERLKPALSEAFCQIVGDWAAFNGIRNTIAHSRWTVGDRPDSIKPRNVSTKQGRAKFVGDDDDEQSYTAPELDQILLELDAINERLKKFLIDSGLQRIIEEKMEGDTFEKSR
jgi:hypothetical protein